MPLVGVCEECKDEKPVTARLSRVHLTIGPHGRRLCSKHARAAWDDWEENERKKRQTAPSGTKTDRSGGQP